MRIRNFVTVAFLIWQGIVLAAPTPLHAAENVKLLAQRAESLIGEIGPDRVDQPSEEVYRLATILAAILDAYPLSLEARLLERGRLGRARFDLDEVKSAAEHWANGNPDVARRLFADADADADRGDGGRTVAQTPDPAPVRIPPRDPVQMPVRTPEPAAPQTDRPGRQTAGLTLPKPVDPIDFSTFLAPPADKSANPAGSTVKMTRAEVFRNLRRSTVLLYIVGPSKSGGGLVPLHIGTGFFISPTLLLTNAHVEEADDKYNSTWLAINESIGVRVVHEVSNARKSTPIKIDAALMRTDGFESPHYISLNRHHEEDEWIAIAGYPGPAARIDHRYTLLENAIRASKAPGRDAIPSALVDEGRINTVITNYKSLATDLQYTMVTSGGNSGSPVVNACGQAVGLHYSGTSDKNSNAKYNMAVAMADVALFLDQIGSGVSVPSTPCQVGF